MSNNLKYKCYQKVNNGSENNTCRLAKQQDFGFVINKLKLNQTHMLIYWWSPSQKVYYTAYTYRSRGIWILHGFIRCYTLKHLFNI